MQQDNTNKAPLPPLVPSTAHGSDAVNHKCKLRQDFDTA